MLVIVSMVKHIHAQDVNYTQFYADKLNLNPALTGSSPCKRAFVSYRNQWPNLGNTYVTYTASYDQGVSLLNGGLGFRIMYDQQGGGNFSHLRAEVSYAYHLKLTKEIALLLGLQGGLVQFGQNATGLIFPNQTNYTTTLGPSTEQVALATAYNFDGAGGFAVYGSNFYVGAAVHNLMQVEVAPDIRIPMKITAHAGMKFVINSSKRFGYDIFTISPNLIAQIQGNNKKLNYGLYLQYNKLVFGAWAKNTSWTSFSAVSLLFGVDTDKWRVAYSYDINTTKLSLPAGGAHEITAGYFFDCQKKSKYKGVGTITCPSF